MQDITLSNINVRALRKFDLNTLLALHTLLETQSVSQTAQRLHLGQPAISHILKRLREHTQDPLLIRQGRGYLLSAYAESLRQPLADCLALAQDLINPSTLFDPAAANGEIHLSMPDLVEVALLPELVEQLRREAPNLLLRIESTAPDDLEDAISNGRIDATIGYFPRPRSSLMHEHLFSAGICCFYHPAQLQLAAPLSASELAALPHITAHYAGTGNSIVDGWFRKQGLARRILVSTGSFQPITPLLARTPAIALLPEVMARLLGDELCAIPLTDPALTLPIDLAWHPRNNLDPLHSYLRQKLREIARKLAPDTAEAIVLPENL